LVVDAEEMLLSISDLSHDYRYMFLIPRAGESPKFYGRRQVPIFTFLPDKEGYRLIGQDFFRITQQKKSSHLITYGSVSLPFLDQMAEPSVVENGIISERGTPHAADGAIKFFRFFLCLFVTFFICRIFHPASIASGRLKNPKRIFFLVRSSEMRMDSHFGFRCQE
jgi:hypothetical protein